MSPLSFFLGLFRRAAQPPHVARRAPSRSAPSSSAAPRASLPEALDRPGVAPIVVRDEQRLPGSPLAPARTPSAAALAFVETVGQLPIFSGTAMQLMRSVGAEDVSSGELARLIAADAGLAAQLLRVVNAPAFGLARPCTTVLEAIAVVGLERVRRMVSAAVTRGPLTTYLRDSRVVTAFWRHQLLSAALARHLARRGGLDGELAYMAGLMHEVGRLAILVRHPHLTDVLLNVEGGDDDHLGRRRELQHFGFDHAEVGGALLAHWGLPPAIVRATDEHESEERPSDPLSAAVWRANLLAHDLIGEPEAIEEPLPWMTAIDLTVEERERIFEEIAALEN